MAASTSAAASVRRRPLVLFYNRRFPRMGDPVLLTVVRSPALWRLCEHLRAAVPPSM